MNERLCKTRMTFASRSEPAEEVNEPTEVSPFSETAIALMVKSRRYRSWRIDACSTAGSAPG